MKNSLKMTVTALILALLLALMAGCAGTPAATTTTTAAETTTAAAAEGDLWANATYTADTELGEGAPIVEVEVKAGDKSITFTVHTNKATLGEALLEHDLIAGDESEYGLYVKVVNGIQADYDTDQAYWALSKDGEMLMTGVDSTPIANGAHYELVYTKG